MRIEKMCEHHHHHGHEHSCENQKLQLIKIGIALFLFAGAMIANLSGLSRFLVFFAAYIIAGGDVLLKAFKNILKGEIFDENFLMGIATFGAFAIKEYPEAVMVMILYQIGEFLQHLVSCTKVKGIRLVAVVKALGGQENVTVDFILRIQEMHVSCGDDGLLQGFPQPDNGPVKLPQLFFAFCDALFQHKPVVRQRLNFQEIVERGDTPELFFTFAAGDGLKQLAGFAGRADDQSFPVGHQFRFGDSGIAFKILQVAQGDQMVQISQAGLVFCKQNDMPGMAVMDLVFGAKSGHRRIDGL